MKTVYSTDSIANMYLEFSKRTTSSSFSCIGVVITLWLIILSTNGTFSVFCNTCIGPAQFIPRASNSLMTEQMIHGVDSILNTFLLCTAVRSGSSQINKCLISAAPSTRTCPWVQSSNHPHRGNKGPIYWVRKRQWGNTRYHHCWHT